MANIPSDAAAMRMRTSSLVIGNELIGTPYPFLCTNLWASQTLEARITANMAGAKSSALRDLLR